MVSGYRTTANLTDESRTKLAQAKSKGLTHTLITESLTLGKCWKEIKDLLYLKICNSDIHTSVSCFMDIKQNDKKSLAAYIHRFKREAKRCNFTNSATTIRIFVKRLKNVHSLAACVYEKGPPTLTDAITEVEKLLAAKQLTATLLPSSMVNVMSSDGDQCFQCQKLGHITCHFLNVHCFDCDEYSHITADCPDRIPPSGMPACHRAQNCNTRHCPRSILGTTTGTGIRIAGLGHSHTLANITVTVAITQIEVIPDHTTDATTAALHDVATPALTVIAVTHHTGHHPHIEVHQLNLEIAANPDHALPIKQIGTPHLNQHPPLAGQQ